MIRVGQSSVKYPLQLYRSFGMGRGLSISVAIADVGRRSEPFANMITPVEKH